MYRALDTTRIGPTKKALARGLCAVVILAAIPFAGCASSPQSDPDSEPEPGPAGEYETAEVDEVLEAMDEDVCQRNATVTVHVWNQGSAAVRIAFGSYTPARATEAFERTTYNVARPHLQYAVAIRIARGGLQVGPPAQVQTEAVVCNDAVLVVGAKPRYSVFYGDMIYSPADLRAAQEEAEKEEEAAEASPADTSAAGDGSEG